MQPRPPCQDTVAQPLGGVQDQGSAALWRPCLTQGRALGLLLCVELAEQGQPHFRQRFTPSQPPFTKDNNCMLPPLFPQRPTGPTPTLAEVRAHDHVAPPSMHGMLGIVSLMIFLFVYREHGVYLGWSGGDNAWSPVQRALYATAAATIPMMLWAVFVDKVHLRPSAGLNLGTPPPPPRTTKRYLSALIPVGILWVVLLGAFWGWWSLLGPVGWADYFWDHLINPKGGRTVAAQPRGACTHRRSARVDGAGGGADVELAHHDLL